MAPVLIACALVAVLVAASAWANAGKVYRGVEVGSVPLGGKTPEEARSALEARAGELERIQLDGPSEAAIGAGEMGVDYDVAATVERAYAVGREGGIATRLGDRIKATFGAARVAPEVDYSTGVARAELEDLAARVNEEPRNASVTVEGTEVRVVESGEGYELDVPATAANVERAVEGMTGEAFMVGKTSKPGVATPAAEEAAEKARRAMAGPVVLFSGERQWELSPAEIGRSLRFEPSGGGLRVVVDREALRGSLGDVYAALEEEPVEAGYRIDGGAATVTPGRQGKGIDEEGLFSSLEDGLLEGRPEYRVPVATVEPRLTTAEAERLKPTERLGSYRTDYRLSSDKSDERMENLRMSSGAVDGTLLAPGEVFSMNDKVSGLDYNASKVIVNGRETLADGGGLCQVTSTLYNAVNEAGLDVVERSPHYAQLPYIRPGLDATVWFGGPNGEGELDMKFENTTGAYVLVRQYVSGDGYVYAEVWGQPTGTEVRTWSEPVYRNADSAEWVTYQTYEKDGEVLYDGVLHRDTYQALKDDKGRPIPADTVPVAPNNP